MAFRIRGLSPDRFRRFFSMTDQALRDIGIEPAIADESAPGYPCRVSLSHAAPGERLILVNFEHQPERSPYRSAHAIYVAENSEDAFDAIDRIPEIIRVRMLSVRAFDAKHMMIAADVVDGENAAAHIVTAFRDPDAAYLHIHFAKRGCFAARVDRA